MVGKRDPESDSPRFLQGMLPVDVAFVSSLRQQALIPQPLPGVADAEHPEGLDGTYVQFAIIACDTMD